MSYSNKNLLVKYFDLCREYQDKTTSKKIAKVLKDYLNRLDG